ncbi:hypothetical protein ACS0TY_033979 [Phlomoides rotata]
MKTHTRGVSLCLLLGHPKKSEIENPMEEKKLAAEEKKEEAPKAAEDGKKSEEPAPPPPPPQEIVLKVFMHCEGCARKVRRCLKGFEGVEEVITDCKTSKVIVRGEKADPAKVFERVQRKNHRHVELIAPVPKPPPPEEDQKPPEKQPEEKKPEAVVISVVLGVYMHCDACAEEIKRRILRMDGVESAETDLKGSQVTVKGVFEPKNLTDYMFKRTGKHGTIVKVDHVDKKDEEKPMDAAKEEKKAEGGEKEVKKGEELGPKEGGGDAAAKPEESKMELKKNDQMYYDYPPNYQLHHPRFVQEMSNYPPQIFSDENPNACCVM